MKSSKIILESFAGKAYEHGEIIHKRIDDCETSVEINASLAIVSDNLENLKKDITEVLQKYAI